MVQQQPPLERSTEHHRHHTAAATSDNERKDALFTIAALIWYRRQASGSVEVHARMACLLTTRHDRVVRSQAVEVQWSSHQVDFYD